MKLIAQGKSNWKFLLIVVILAVIVGGGVLLYSNNINKQIISSSQMPEIKTPEKVHDETGDQQTYKNEGGQIEKPYTIIYPQTEISGDKTEYTIDTAKFEVIKKEEVFTTDPFSEEDPYTEYSWSFVAYNNGIKIYEIPMSEASPHSGGISAFEYKNNKYISISDYSGGAHCCYSYYVFVLTDKELKLVSILDGYIEITTAGDKVYLSKLDDRFDYFYSSHASSYFFKRYFLVDNDKIIESNVDFQTDYLKKAEDCDKELNKGLQQNEYSGLSFSNLVCKVVNYLIIGDSDKAWINFEDYFNKIKSNPNSETYELKGKDAGTIKAEIINKMKDLL